VTGTLTGADGSIQSFNLDADAFKASGATTTMNVDKYAQQYVWHVTANAGLAPSIAVHQALTTGDGWNQVLQDASQATGACDNGDPSPCDLVWVT